MGGGILRAATPNKKKKKKLWGKILKLPKKNF